MLFVLYVYTYYTTPRDELDRMMAEVVMLASKMEFTEIELQV